MNFKNLVFFCIFALLTTQANASVPDRAVEKLEAKIACLESGQCQDYEFDEHVRTSCEITIASETCKQNVDPADLMKCDELNAETYDMHSSRPGLLWSCWVGIQDGAVSFGEWIVETAKSAWENPTAVVQGVAEGIESALLYLPNEYDRVATEDLREDVKKFWQENRPAMMAGKLTKDIHKLIEENPRALEEVVILSKMSNGFFDQLMTKTKETKQELSDYWDCMSAEAIYRKACEFAGGGGVVGAAGKGAKMIKTKLKPLPSLRQAKKLWAKKIEKIEAQLEKELKAVSQPLPPGSSQIKWKERVDKVKRKAAAVRDALRRLKNTRLPKKVIKYLNPRRLEVISQVNRIVDSKLKQEKLLDLANWMGTIKWSAVDHLTRFGVISNIPVHPRVYVILKRNISDEEMTALAKAGDMTKYSEKRDFLKSAGFKDEEINQLLKKPYTLHTPPAIMNLYGGREIKFLRTIHKAEKRILKRKLSPSEAQALARTKAIEWDNSFKEIDTLSRLRAQKQMLIDEGFKPLEVRKLIEENFLDGATESHMAELFLFNRRASPRRSHDFNKEPGEGSSQISPVPKGPQQRKIEVVDDFDQFNRNRGRSSPGEVSPGEPKKEGGSILPAVAIGTALYLRNQKRKKREEEANVGNDNSNSPRIIGRGDDEPDSPQIIGRGDDDSGSARSSGRDDDNSGSSRSSGSDDGESGSSRSSGRDDDSSSSSRSSGKDDNPGFWSSVFSSDDNDSSGSGSSSSSSSSGWGGSSGGGGSDDD